MIKISKEAKKILNSEKLIAKRDEWFKRLRNVFDGKKQEDCFFLSGTIVSSDSFDPYTQPYEWMVDSLERLASQCESVDSDIMFLPPCVEMGHYGVHFVDKMFGAEVYFDNEQWNAKYLDASVGELNPVNIFKDDTFDITVKAIKAFTDSDVKLPLLGLPTIASALNIAVNLYGEEILVSAMSDKESAEKDFIVINDTLKNLHRYYIENIPKKQLQPVISWERTQPPEYGQICGCTNQLVSPAFYDEYLSKLDNDLLGVYKNGGMMHLCGSHTQHIPVFNKMTNLKALQLNDRAAGDLEEYHKRLRKDIVFYVLPCPEMSFEDAVKITGGQRLVIMQKTNKTIKCLN